MNEKANGAKKVKIFGEEIAVNARIEYIEGYSGHADQEGLMNFIYSFIEKPKKEPTRPDICPDGRLFPIILHVVHSTSASCITK